LCSRGCCKIKQMQVGVSSPELNPTKMGANNTNDSSTEIEKTQKKVSHCWGNAQIPFALPFLTLPNSNFATFLSPPQLHTSFTAAADHFLTLLHSLASQNPFLNKIISLPSQFHTLCVQVLLKNFPLFASIYVAKIMLCLGSDSETG